MAFVLQNNNFMTAHNRKKKKQPTVSNRPHTKKPDTMAVCMIVKNEEQRLPLILSDIKGLWDELIIVDTGSTDRTIEIAQSFRARVVSQPWNNDFSAARNRSKDEATAAWIMWLDADDRMDPKQVKQLQCLKQTLDADCVYNMTVASPTEDGSSDTFMQYRLFPNDPRLRFENRIHETISQAAMRHGFKRASLPIQIIHTGYETHEIILLKIRRNLPILEDELAENPDNIMLRFVYANGLVDLNRTEEAQLHYEEIVRRPGAPQQQEDIYHKALVSLARMHGINNNHIKAAELAERAVEVKPQDIQGWYYWGSALMRLKENEAALEKILRALACRNIASTVPVRYGALRTSCLTSATILLVSMGRQQEAEDLLRNALKQDPSPQLAEILDKLQKSRPSEEELLQKGQKLLESQAYAEASRIFLHVIESNPHSLAAYNGLGLISWYSGKYEDAYVLFKKAVETGPVHEDILLNLWDAAQVTENIKDTRALLEDILTRNPGMETIKELIEKKL
jgi:glycosyltransferase involved in cell wall biosynthesis